MGKKMTSRERVIKSLEHKEPDRVPLDIGGGPTTTIVVEGYERLKEYLGIKEKTFLMNKTFRLARISNKVMNILESDLYHIGLKPSSGLNPVDKSEDSFIDKWGVTWKKAYYNEGKCFYYEVEKSPLDNATIEDLKNYNWPDPYDKGYTLRLENDAKRLFNNTERAIMGHSGFINIWEKGVQLRGFENLLLDIAINQRFFVYLMEKILEINVIVMGRFLDSVGNYIQVVRTGDDMATQNGLLLRPDDYRKLIKPFYRRFYEFIKSKTDAKIFYHSCGNVTGILHDLIDIGLDIINPVQVSALGDIKKLKKEFGKDLVFWGGIDTQHILPEGSVHDVQVEVKKRIMEMAHEGGYVLAAVHNIQPDVPPENIIAMAEASRKFGVYPLDH